MSDCCDVFIITISDINRFTGLPILSDPDTVSALVLTIQLRELKPILGADLYQNLINAIELNELDACQKSLICQIKPFLSFTFKKEWQIETIATDTATGLKNITSEGVSIITERQFAEKNEKATDNYIFFKNELINWLYNAADCFPTWSKNCGSKRFSVKNINIVSTATDWRME